MTNSDNTILGAAATDSVSQVLFEDLGLHADILRALSEEGYSNPTPIQAQAIPIALSGQDLMGAAQTGTGKTAGFCLPILQNLLPHSNYSASPARHPVRALVLTPTRELADQIFDNVRRYAKYTALRSTVVFGGVDIVQQHQQLRQGVEILIATPGRLLDHVQQKSVNLSQVQILVLDEADRMLDMGFLPDLQRIINLLPQQRQNLMFSATFSNEINKLARSFMRSPVTVEVARRNATSENIQQVVFPVEFVDYKLSAVSHLLRHYQLKQAIVFTNTKLAAGRLVRQLLADQISACAIHGDKTQSDRMKALDAFKSGEVTVLVATDVAARGIDIADLPCVINFDLPHSPEDYVHRIGRTGRAGAQGVAYSLLAPGDERHLVEIEKLIKKSLTQTALIDFNPVLQRGRFTPRSSQQTTTRLVPPGDVTSRLGSRRRLSKDEKTTELRFDEEFERLRRRLQQSVVHDDLFRFPYTEKLVAVTPSSGFEFVAAKRSRPKSVQSHSSLAVLLGGVPKHK